MYFAKYFVFITFSHLLHGPISNNKKKNSESAFSVDIIIYIDFYSFNPYIKDLCYELVGQNLSDNAVCMFLTKVRNLKKNDLEHYSYLH